MDRFDFYFRQKVTESELDAAYDAVEEAFADFKQAVGVNGVNFGGNVVQDAPTASLNVTAAGPFIGYDDVGNRIKFAADQTLDLSVDETSSATAVSGGGNERILSIFIRHERTLSDTRIDGNGTPVFFSRADGFVINVAAGAEAPTGTAVGVPLRSGSLLLADVTLAFGQTQILNANIDNDTRKQWAFRTAGDEVVAGTVPVAIQQITTLAADVSGALADQTAPDDGATLIGTDAIVGAPSSLSQDTLKAVLTQLLGHVNARALLAGANTFTGGAQTISAQELRLAGAGAQLLFQGLPLGNDEGLIQDDRVTGSTDYVLVARFGDPTANDDTVRLWRTLSGMAISKNCFWNEASNLWVSDQAGSAALWNFEADTPFNFQNRSGIAGPAETWTDNPTGWGPNGGPRFLMEFSDGLQNIHAPNGRLQLGRTGLFGDMDESNPSAFEIVTANSLYAKNIPKAWVRFRATGTGLAVAEDGYGLVDTLISVSDGRISFRRAFDNVQYAVLARADNAHTIGTVVQILGSYTFRMFDSAGATVNLATTAATIDILVYGEVTD